MYKQEFKNKQLNILRSKEGLVLRLNQLVKFYIWKILAKKHARNVPQQLVPGPYLILVKSPKNNQCIKERFFVNKTFWIYICQICSKVFFFSVIHHLANFDSLTLNLDGLFRGSFWGVCVCVWKGGGGETAPHCLKLVRILLETWNSVRR